MRIVIAIILAGCVVIVLYVATTPGFSVTYSTVHGFFQETVGLSAPTAGIATDFVRKLFHLPMYALIAAFAWGVVPVRRHRVVAILGVVLAVAVIDESLQAAHPGRTGSPWDALLDLGGGMIGIAVARRLQARKETAQQRRRMMPRPLKPPPESRWSNHAVQAPPARPMVVRATGGGGSRHRENI